MATEPKKAPHLVDPAKAHLERLDSLLDEVAGNYVDRLHREIAALGEILKRGHGKKRLKKSQTQDLKQIDKWCKELQVRGDRGRRKDLKKIDALIGDVQRLLEHW